MKIQLLIVSFAIFNLLINSQEMLSNGGFETYSSPPYTTGSYMSSEGWGNLNGEGTPDFLTIDGDYPVQLPNNSVFGELNPHNGKAVMGLIAFANSSEAREYLSKQLENPLEIGKEYQVSFWVTNGIISFTSGGCDCLGLHFTCSQLNQTILNVVSLTPHFTIPDTLYTHQWKNYTFNFVADSAYNYISLGNFKYDSETTVIKFDTINSTSTARTTYYFIDDISVKIPVAETNEQSNIFPNIFTPNNDGINDLLIYSLANKYTDAEFTILNRWGEQVYHTFDHSIIWDGKVKDKYCEDGIYYWILKYTDDKAEHKSETGFIHLTTSE